MIINQAKVIGRSVSTNIFHMIAVMQSFRRSLGYEKNLLIFLYIISVWLQVCEVCVRELQVCGIGEIQKCDVFHFGIFICFRFARFLEYICHLFVRALARASSIFPF